MVLVLRWSCTPAGELLNCSAYLQLGNFADTIRVDQSPLAFE